jgi:hypothetical protein
MADIDIGPRPSETIDEFCRAENFSKSFYYELKKRNLAPDELRPPGTKVIRITPEAHAAWRGRMAELSRTEAAELEATRRRELAVIAGKLAAKSERHVSKKKKETPPRRRRSA